MVEVSMRKKGGRPLIYLDNSATTKTDPEVIRVIADVMENVYANPASLHGFGGKAERLVEQARKVIAKELGCEPNEIIFTSGGTESNNLAIKGIASAYQGRGKHIITSMVEHPAVFDVCQHLEQKGWSVTYLPVDEHGRVDPDQLERAITDETVLVSIMHVNNEVGAIQPIFEIGKRLKKYPKVFFHVDAVQSFGKLPLNVKEANIDLLSLSGHKFHGPKGIGCLYVRKSVQLTPLFHGGGQEQQIRSGTLNVPGIAGLAKAIVLAQQKRHLVDRMQQWKERFLAEIQEIPMVRVNGDVTSDGAAPYIISLSFPGLKAEVIVHALEERGIYVSSKSACSSKLAKPSRVLKAMGRTDAEALGSIRISLGYFSSEDDLIECAKALNAIIPQLQQVMKVHGE